MRKQKDKRKSTTSKRKLRKLEAQGYEVEKMESGKGCGCIAPQNALGRKLTPPTYYLVKRQEPAP